MNKGDVEQVGKKRIPRQHRGSAQTALIAAAGTGPIGSVFAAADIAAIAGIWGTYLYSVASKEGYHLTKDDAVKICKSALLGLGGYYVGCKTATKFFLLIPGAGLLAAMGVSALTNILFTYRFALTVCTMFKSRYGAFDAGELAENIKHMFAGNGIADYVREIIDIYRNG